MNGANLYAEDYYNWLLSFIEDDEHDLNDYSSLLWELFNFEFYEIVRNDSNRVADGLALRNRFSEEIGEHLYFVIDELPEGCSCLEMMIALAIRLEENILRDPDKGDRTSLWFWVMVENLGLIDEVDDNFDRDFVRDILDRFVERRLKNGQFCGLFNVTMATFNLKNVEIWYQANYFFAENLKRFE